MKYSNKEVGNAGENYAVSYLLSNKYSIIGRNVTSRFGEIDIIAEKNEVICFIEVKSKISLRQGKPYEEVTAAKVRKLKRAVEYYLLHNNFSHRKLRTDVISIFLDEELNQIELKHYENLEL